MQVRIPANYRQGFQWLYGLDAPSGILLGLGVMTSLKVFTGHAPWPVKIPEMAVALAAGGFFGLVKWPLERNGDRMTIWVRRALAYQRRPRYYSAFVAARQPASARRLRAKGDSA